MKTKSKLFISIFFFTLLSAGFAQLALSRPPSRAQSLTPEQKSELKQFSKAGNGITVTISSLADSVYASGDKIVLEAEITVPATFTNVHFRWNFPDDIIASSTIDGDLGTLEPGTPTKVQLFAVSQTAENRQIHLSVVGLEDGIRLIQSAQYNTVNQARIETKAYNKLQSMKLQAAQAKSKTKFMQ